TPRRHNRLGGQVCHAPSPRGNKRHVTSSPQTRPADPNRRNSRACVLWRIWRDLSGNALSSRAIPAESFKFSSLIYLSQPTCGKLSSVWPPLDSIPANPPCLPPRKRERIFRFSVTEGG